MLFCTSVAGDTVGSGATWLGLVSLPVVGGVIRRGALSTGLAVATFCIEASAGTGLFTTVAGVEEAFVVTGIEEVLVVTGVEDALAPVDAGVDDAVPVFAAER